MNDQLLSLWRLPDKSLIGADQLSAVVRAAPVALLCGLINALIVTASFWSAVDTRVLIGWLMLAILITAYYIRNQNIVVRDVGPLSRSAMNRAMLGTAVLALPWGLLSLLYLGRVPQINELVLITVCAGMSAGGGVLLSPLYPAAMAYVAVVLVPFAVMCFVYASSGYALLGLLAVSYGGFLWAVIATAARLSVERTEAVRQLTRSTQLLTERDTLISEQNLRFETAINNMTQGLCLFDGDERLIVCNHRYVEFYGLDPELIRPGITLGEILDMRYGAGTAPAGTKADYLAWRNQVGRSGGPTETVCELDNGRVYAVRYRPMTGGAWVATTDDITDQHRLRQEVEENHRRIKHMATHDALTGLSNRVVFREQLDCAVEMARAHGDRIGVLMLDLNKFKQVNDTLGHPVGDLLLAAVAARLKGCIRPEATVARLGGDEFAIVMPSIAAAADAEEIAKRILGAVCAPYELDEQRVAVGASIGIALARGSEAESEQLVRQADTALYYAKSFGGDCYRFFGVDLELPHANRAA